MVEKLQSPAKEPCASCGEETGVGSVHFPDRLTFSRDGQADVFLCSICEARIRASGKPGQVTEDGVINVEWLMSAGDQVFFRF